MPKKKAPSKKKQKKQLPKKKSQFVDNPGWTNRPAFEARVAALDPPLRLPLVLPNTYPLNLIFHTELALREVNAKGYTRKYLVEACCLLVDGLSLHVCAAVKVGNIHPIVAEAALRAVVEQIIDDNCGNDQEREDAKRQFLSSGTWLHLGRDINEALRVWGQTVGQASKPVVSPPEIATEPEPSIFTHSDDYRDITFQGEPYSLSEKQAAQMKVLYEAYEKGSPLAVPKERLLDAVNAPRRSEVRSFWRDSPLWGNLIIKGVRRGTYKLNLELPPPKHRPN